MSILIIGGTSDIGQEIAIRLCPGEKVVLAGRSVAKMEAFSTELIALGAAQVDIVRFDATELASHRLLVHQAEDLAGEITVAVVAFGILGNQERAQKSAEHVIEIVTIDYTAQLSMLTVLADEMRNRRGAIVAFSSIAGWRPRRANYVYGSTKAGLDAFCQGLSDSLHNSPLRILTIRPGFVIGKMTTGMTPAPLAVYPSTVAEAVVKSINSGRSSTTIWVPQKLRLLAWVMRLVARAVWRRLPR